MDGEPRDKFWGKLRLEESGRVVAWHPLEHHCADVAACAWALLEATLLRRRIAVAAGLEDLDDTQVQRLVVLAALHDIGKFNLGFQNKALSGGPTAGHVREAATLLLSARDYPDLARPLLRALDADALSQWGETGEAAAGLLLASISHHGRPAVDPVSLQTSWWKAARGLDPFEGIAGLVNATKRWCPRAWAADARRLPAAPALQHAFAGLVMLADWLGSDTRFFEYSRPADGDRFVGSLDRARLILAEGHIDPTRARAALGEPPVAFGRVLPGHAPREVQRRIMELPLPESASVTVLESETGSGKTEAVLARFLQLHQRGMVDGMYFALPTRTAATQLHGRVCAIVAQAFEADPPPVVMAVPGYIVADEQQATRLPHFEVLWNDDARERYRYRGWAAEHPKRYLAAPIAVGTIDQVLLSALKVGHAHMRATALSRQLLVVDEVHASDTYMTTVLRAVLRWHARCGGHAVLLSATLGSDVRAQLLHDAGATVDPLDLATACQAPYPSLLHWERGGDPAWTTVSEAGRPKDVAIELEPTIDAPEAIASRALTAAGSGAKVLIIRNTVRGALAVQEALERLAVAGGKEHLLFRCAGVPAPHHSRFARPDREALDDAIERAFGKARSKGGCVAVATQTVQQSLDLDADWMISDLCPMDVLLQRVGRLHRHERSDRPHEVERAQLLVLTPDAPDLSEALRPSGEASGSHGMGTVYHDLRVLQATWERLASSASLAVPAMNRELVEHTTHPDAVRALHARGDLWARHGQHVSGRALAERVLGRHNLVRRDEPFLGSEVAFPERGVDADHIRTRLGEDDRRIVLPSAAPGPFGRSICEILLPGWQARDLPSEPHVSMTRQGDGALDLAIADVPFVYDRLGLRPLPPRPPEVSPDA